MKHPMNEEQMRAEFEDWWKRTLLIKHELSIREIITYCERSPYGDYVYSGTALRWDGWKAALASQASDDRVRKLETKYNELIMAVARKFPNETRHETALRYIRNAEASAVAPCRESRDE